MGLWIEQTEGAKFWLRVMNELKNRGVEDILIAVVDGLKGFPEAITAVFPQTQVQTCIVHLIRNSLDFVSYKDRKPVATALKQIYRAKDAGSGQEELENFAESPWGQKISGDRAILAAPLERGDPVLCIPRRRAPDHLHHKRYRIFERKTSTRRTNAWTFSNR